MNETLVLFLQVSFIIIIYAILAYVFYIMRQMKYLKNQQVKFSNVNKQVALNKKVVLTSGLIGIVVGIKDEVLMVELAKGITIETLIYSVQEVIE